MRRAAGVAMLAAMSNPVRITLRLLGLILFLGSLAGMAYIVGAGPDTVARQMGRECANTAYGHDNVQWCTWQDVLGILKALPWVCLVGGVLVVWMQPGGLGKHGSSEPQPATLDLSGGGMRFSTGLKALGVLGMVVAIAGSFAGTRVYSAGYTVNQLAKVHKELRKAAEKRERIRRPGDPRPAVETPAPGPRGLAKGSLLRAKRFRAAVAELRRAAPKGARISGLRVAADRIDAEVIARGRVVRLRKAWNAKATVVSTDPALDGELPIISFARLDTAAPQRVARAAGARKVDYLVLQDVVGLRWRGFLAGGKGQVTASPDGRDVA